jgi:hypothetical protein
MSTRLHSTTTQKTASCLQTRRRENLRFHNRSSTYETKFHYHACFVLRGHTNPNLLQQHT